MFEITTIDSWCLVYDNDCVMNLYHPTKVIRVLSTFELKKAEKCHEWIGNVLRFINIDYNRFRL